jgi:LCP family protein required for cell wall assembly
MDFTTRRIREEKPSRWKPLAQKLSPYALKAGALMAAFYGKWKQRKEEEEASEHRAHILKRVMVVLLSILLGLVLLAGTVKALVGLRILTLQNFLSVAGSDLPVDDDGFTNFLLLGAGDKDHDGVDLTDAVMIVSMDPKKTRSAVMLSIPRDLYVLHSELMGEGRVNELYRNYKNQLRREGVKTPDASAAALKQLAVELSTLTGIKIHHVVKIDFTAFVETVDALGGIEVAVPEDIVDTQYPGPNYTYETFEIHAGPQVLDGETALKYARSRHSTSDFSRSGRQQLILKALAEKARSSGVATSPSKLTAIYKIVAEHVESTMSIGEILGAAKLGEKLERDNVISMHLNIGTGYDGGLASPGGFLYTPPREQFDGASVLLPFSIPDSPVTWKQIKTLARLLVENRPIFLLKPPISVLNAGGKTGSARVLGNELIRYGFEVEKMENANDDRSNPVKIPTSVVVARTEEDDELAEFFGTLLHLPVSPLPPGVDPQKQSRVTVVLGEDFSLDYLQDLYPTHE